MLKEFIELQMEYLSILWREKMDGMKTKKSPNEMTIPTN